MTPMLFIDYLDHICARGKYTGVYFFAMNPRHIDLSSEDVKFIVKVIELAGWNINASADVVDVFMHQAICFRPQNYHQ